MDNKKKGLSLPIKPIVFQRSVFIWYRKKGRKTLPWQLPRTPYRVWISEIMLQQTQVNTVIPYFERWMKTFPDVFALAKAPVDRLLALWSGLGYYARARCLHRAARIIVDQYQGEIPSALSELQKLPGIGRSTAGAILSLGFDISAPILDGNVKRVLIRFRGIEQDPAESKVLEKLWRVAETYTPQKNIAPYNQAMMDLGAMICTRTKPLCIECPLKKHCQAYLKNIADQLPVKRKKRTLPVRQKNFLILIDEAGRILLEKRKSTGIWGGLWSFPEIEKEAHDIQSITKKYAVTILKQQKHKTFRHTFTHFHLDITPIRILVRRSKVKKTKTVAWLTPKEALKYGLPQPVKKILLQLK